MQTAKRKVTADGAVWACCAKCSHKLMKITHMPKGTGSGVEIEVKCSSCKGMNRIVVDDMREAGK